MALSFDLNHLLIPFDFSPATIHAVKHAGYLASKFKSRMSVWVAKDKYSESLLRQQDPSYNSALFSQYAARFLQTYLDELAQQFGVKASGYIGEGKLTKELTEFIEQEEVSMVILATHGEKSQDPIFQGSHANKYVMQTKVPVFAVHAQHARIECKRIILPLDISFHTREKIPYGIKLAQAFHAEICIVGLERSSDEESVHKLRSIIYQAENYIHSYGVATRSEVRKGKNMALVTLEAAQELHADLIVIMAENDGPLGGLFSPSYAQQITQNAGLPMIVVPPRVSTVMASVSI